MSFGITAFAATALRAAIERDTVRPAEAGRIS
jgi:hypothetical protein